MFTRYLIKCLSLPCNLPSGSSAQTLRRARQREFDGWDGWDGWKGWTGGRSSKVSLNFSILRCI